MPSTAQSPRRILLTGAAGFVGTYVRAAVATRWPKAEVFALVTAAEAAGGFVVADLLDRPALEAAVAAARPDVVMHLAAQASAVRSAKHAGETWAVNLTGSINLAMAVAVAAPDAAFLFVSSSEVYGASFLAGPVDETTPLLPMNVYARSKAHAERVLADVLAPETRLIVARPFNHTGPGQREDFVLPSFAGQVARIETGRQEPRLAVGNLDVRRDFLDVRDVVAAYLALVEAAPTLPLRFACNVASEVAEPLGRHVETLQGLARCPFEVVTDPERVRRVDVPVAVGSARLLRAITGWAARHDIRTTLEALLDSARERERAAGPDKTTA